MGKTVNDILAAYFPVNAVEAVKKLLEDNRVKLRISRGRLSRLGDFRPSGGGSYNQISINSNLNIYEFQLIFLHELAHLYVLRDHGPGVRPHGREWKECFGRLIREFIQRGFFHPSISGILKDYSYRVKASGVADIALMKALRVFDKKPGSDNWLFLEEVSDNGVFTLRNGRVFQKQERLRTRFRCLCQDTRKQYLIHHAARVRAAGEDLYM